MNDPPWKTDEAIAKISLWAGSFTPSDVINRRSDAGRSWVASEGVVGIDCVMFGIPLVVVQGQMVQRRCGVPLLFRHE